MNQVYLSTYVSRSRPFLDALIIDYGKGRIQIGQNLLVNNVKLF